MPQKNDIGPCTMPVTYLPRHVTSRPACAVARFQPRPTSASGQTRSFGDVGFDVRFARKRTRLRIYESPRPLTLRDPGAPRAYKQTVGYATSTPLRPLTHPTMSS